MANEEKLHLVHVKSSVENKAPTAQDILYGEIAVNFNANSPALSIKDSRNNIVKFTPNVVDGELDETSPNPVANSAVTTAIFEDELAISAALNDLNDRKADISYVEAAISSITIDVDSQLDTASTNPVENRVITQVIIDNEEVISTALNDLNERKADMSYVDDAVSGVTSYVDEAVSSITIDVDSEFDSASTNPLENRVVTQRFRRNEKVVSAALNDLNNRLGEKVTELSSASTDDEYPSAKAAYDEIHPKVESTIPSGGLYPNVFYNLGTLTGSVTISFSSPFDPSVENEYRFRFSTSSTAPTITWPSSITKWAGNCLDSTMTYPSIGTNATYEVSVVDGLAIIIAYI